MKISVDFRRQMVRDLDKKRQEINTRLSDAIDIVSHGDCDCATFECCAEYSKFRGQLEKAEAAIKAMNEYITAIDTIAR